MNFKVALDRKARQQFACARRLAGGRFISKCVFYSIEEIGIREISAANTFAYAYVCLLRYVSNSIVFFSHISIFKTYLKA